MFTFAPCLRRENQGRGVNGICGQEVTLLYGNSFTVGARMTSIAHGTLRRPSEKQRHTVFTRGQVHSPEGAVPLWREGKKRDELPRATEALECARCEAPAR